MSPRTRVSCLGATLLACSLGAAASAQVTTERDRVLVKYGAVQTLTAPLVLTATGSATGTVATQPVGSQGKTSLRIAFRFPEAPSATGWTLRVTHGGQVLWTLKAGEQPAGTERFWSPEFQGNSVNVELQRTDASAKVKVNIEALGEGNALHTKPQAIIGPDQREKFANQPAEIKTAGRSVVRIRFIDAASHDMFVCTGFVVFAPDILMTNEHCLKEPSEVASAEIDFDFDRPDATPKTVKLKEFVVPPDAGLDFALVRLKQASDRTPLKLRAAAAENTKDLLVIEHPAGESKQVSRVDCRVQGVDLIGRGTDKTDFGHTCDTLGGSSGSPVLDPAHLEVVGLHHLAVTTAGVVVNQAVNINLIKAKCGAACATP